MLLSLLLLYASEASPAGGTPRFRTLKSETARHAEKLKFKAGDILGLPDLLREG
jgi:hypothetical protein